MSQQRVSASLFGIRFNNGEQAVCEDQIRPVIPLFGGPFVRKYAAMILSPSAEEHTVLHQATGTAFEFHVWPKFVEV
jgi:hypothetical protein